MSIPECGKGTFNGARAASSPYGFAPCTEPKEHGGECDSGPAETQAAA